MRFFLIIYTLFFVSTSIAQTQFITSAKVEYEKKVNQHSQLDQEGDNQWVQEYRKQIPKTVTDYYVLKFNSEKSVYKLAKENTDVKYLWGTKPTENDVIVKDFTNNSISLQREVFENTYLVKDSLKQLNWKITDETRTIAGFECKKAITKIHDSVYVVAFYTDQIMISSGPESFSGLPGLILGLAIPRLYTTWFATKVELVEPSITELSPVQKGKKATWKTLLVDLNKGVKDWGKEGKRFIWTFSL
ncbi:MAG: GLPGLI family protein [Chitinophagaceae bacterium]|jgi:GLPGLI family protein